MSHNTPISDELLSAYLDDAVSLEERAQVEEAVARDPDVAWRLSTLRYTVGLLRQLPEIAAPQPFILTESQVTRSFEPAAPRATTAGAAARPAKLETDGTPWWRRWHAFWQAGNPVWRNAAAACAALLLVLVVGDNLFTAPVATSFGTQEESDAVTSTQQSDDAALSATSTGSAQPVALADTAPLAEAPPADTEPDTAAATAAKAAPQAEASVVNEANDGVDAQPQESAAGSQADAPQAVAAEVMAADDGEVQALSLPPADAEMRVGAGEEVPGDGTNSASENAADGAVLPFAAAPAEELSIDAADVAPELGSDDQLGELFAAPPPAPMAAAAMAQIEPTSAEPAVADTSETAAETAGIASDQATDSPPTETLARSAMPSDVPAATPSSEAIASASTANSPAPSGATVVSAPAAEAPSMDGTTGAEASTAPLDWLRVTRWGLAALAVVFAVLWLWSRRTEPAVR